MVLGELANHVEKENGVKPLPHNTHPNKIQMDQPHKCKKLNHRSPEMKCR